ncbi:MAG: hypothetical protein ACHREM_08010 [Polyangiales bacterium]
MLSLRKGSSCAVALSLLALSGCGASGTSGGPGLDATTDTSSTDSSGFDLGVTPSDGTWEASDAAADWEEPAFPYDADATADTSTSTDTGPDIADDTAASTDAGPDIAADTATSTDAGPDVIDDTTASTDVGPDVADAIADTLLDAADAHPTDAVVDTSPTDTGACDPVTNAGCTSSQKCTVGTPNVCIAKGTVATGQPCGSSGHDDCVAGDICIGTPLRCEQFCNIDSDCKGAAVASGATSEPNNVPRCVDGITGFTTMLCSTACNPVTKAGATGCPGTLACDYSQETSGTEFTDCWPAGAGGDGATCTYTSDCAAGYTCLNNGTKTICRAICRSGAAADCPASGEQCLTNTATDEFGFCCPSSGC